MGFHRIAASWVGAFLGMGIQAFAQYPNAGPDQYLLYPNPAVLAGSVQGGTPLSWWTAEGKGTLANYILEYHDQTGVTPVGPMRIGNGGTFGDPTDFLRIGATVYGIDGLRRQIYTLDGSTGIVTPIGTAWPAVYADVESMTYDATGDRVFAVDRATGQLLTIDRSNNAVTPIGTATLAAYPQIRSLAWRAANALLYAVDQTSRDILSIDPSTGAPTVVCTMAQDPNGKIEELEFVGDRMYAVEALEQTSSAQLQQVLPESGVVQDIGPEINQATARCLLINSLPERHVWSKVSGPGVVTFSDPYSLTPTAAFSQPGVYVLQLRVITASGPVTDDVTITEGSWTLFTPSPDTHAIFVSSSTGNDANDGLSTSTPKRTIAAGGALLRDGFPDWLLLKSGDTFSGMLTDGNGRWEKSGRSVTERMLVTSYNSGPRPVIDSGGGNGFFTPVGVGSVANNLALVGLDFYCSGNTGPSVSTGILVFGSTQNFLVEDCRIRNYSTAGIVLQGTGGRHANAAIRRSIVVDTWTTATFTGNGIYVEATDGVLIEENVVDANGWTLAHPHGSDGPGHNMYIHNNNTGVVIRGNIVADSDGVQLRSGGISTNNLFLRNAISFEMGAGTNPNPAGVSGTINGNVILDGNDFPGNVSGGSGARGWGYVLGNCVGVSMTYNVVAHDVTGTSPRPLVLNFQNNGNPNGLQNVTLDHNVVYDWSSAGSGAQIASYQLYTIQNLTLSSNDIQDTVDANFLTALSASNSLAGQIHGLKNRWFRAAGNANQLFQLSGVPMSFAAFQGAIGDTTSTLAQVQYPDANRTIATYQQSLGGAPTLAAFIAQARQQSKANWRSAYTAKVVNDYVRLGFGLPPIGF